MSQKLLKIKTTLTTLVIIGLVIFQNGSLYAENYYQAGKRAYSMRNYDKAISLFQKSWRSQPRNGNSLYYIGRIHDDQRKRSKAISFYKKSVHLRMEKPLREQALWKIVLYLKYHQKWEELLEYSNLFLKYNKSTKVQRLKQEAESKQDPVMSAVLQDMKRATAQKNSGNYSNALSMYSSILSRKPNFHQARWQSGLILMKVNKYNEANSQFQYLIRNHEEVWEYYYKSAICFYKTGLLEKAKLNLNKAISLNETSKKSFLYHSRYLLALIYFKQNAYTSACKEFAKAREYRTKKRSANLLGYSAISSLECGQKKSAILFSNLALKKDSKQQHALLAKTRINIDNKKYESAYKESRYILKKLMERNSNSLVQSYTPLFFFLGKYASKHQKYNIAIRAFEKVNMTRMTNMARLATKNNSNQDLLWDFNYSFGISLMNVKQYDRSINVLQKLKKNDESTYLLSKSYALKMNTTYAKKYLLKSVQFNNAIWIRAESDPAFKVLMNQNIEFATFIKTRNKPVEKKEIKNQIENKNQ